MRGASAKGAAILSARIQRGLTQAELAALAKLDVKTIRGAEQGKRLDLDTISRIALALGADVSQFIAPGSLEPADEVNFREVILKWKECWDTSDMEGLLALYDDEAVLKLPGGPNLPFGGHFKGKEEIRKTHEMIWASIPQVPTPVEEIAIRVNSDSVTVSGNRRIYLPTGELVPFPVVQVFEFRAGKISVHEVQYDTLDFAKKMNFPTG